jgi:hypothetical protein
VSVRTVTFIGYGALLVAFVAWSVVSARRPNAMSVPDVLDAITRTRVRRFACLAAWAWLGWHLFARGSGAFD